MDDATAAVVESANGVIEKYREALAALLDERSIYREALEQIAQSVDGEHRMGRMEVARLALAALEEK